MSFPQRSERLDEMAESGGGTRELWKTVFELIEAAVVRLMIIRFASDRSPNLGSDATQ